MKAILTILLIFPMLINAQIGYTKDQCDRKYGNSTPDDAQGFVYNYQGLKISVYFSNGKCTQIAYESNKKFTKSKQTLLIKRNVKEKYKLTADIPEEKSKHYKSKNFYIDCMEKEIVITYDPS